MVLKVKKLESAYIKKSGDELNVLLMLPFGFDDGDSKYRSMASDFLTGAKLAIERNAKGGQKLDVKVVDSGSESSFKNSLTQINQNNTDLIVGPFFKSNVLDVLDYVKSKKIPVVAPFANSDELRKFSNLVIVETDQNVFADRIVKEVSLAYSDQKIYIVSDADKTYSSYIKNNLEKQLKNPNITIVNSASEIQLDTNMMTGQTAPVVAILASDNDEQGAIFANKISQIAEETSGVKAFSMYYHPSFEKNVEALGKASLVYLMDRKINNDGAFEKEVLADYKKKYCKTPSKYAVIGFDVVNDMLSRENNKGELFKQMGKAQTQLATKFEFVKSKEGAYVNQGYRVVRLVP
jgi:ABC-type branched-subunit amino acid transport system substrate-binding protein